MELNNSTVTSNQKFININKLHIQDKETARQYDNDGFEGDSGISTTYTTESFPDQTVADDLMTIRVHQLTFPQNDTFSGPNKEISTKSRRQLPSVKNNQCDSAIKSENFEISDLDKRNSLEMVNISCPSNTTNVATQIDKRVVPSNGDVDKLMSNKSVIQAITHMEKSMKTTKNYAESENRLRPTRQSFSVDHTRFNRDVDSIDGPNRLRRVGSLGWEKLRRRPLQLLRDLSFSDANDSTMMDYGSLKNINLPKRPGKGPISPETASILESLMQELTKRGKINQVAVLDLDQSCVLASVPAGFLSYSDVIGMTKAMIGQPSLFRLQIADTDYHCFKHREDAIQGRAPEVVMVMQMADTCLVAGFAREDAPGSCNSEVHEMTKVLIDAGW